MKQITMHTLSLLLLGLLISADGQMLFRILRDRIDGDTARTQELIQESEAPPGLLLEGVPYIDSQSTWQIPLGNTTGTMSFDFISFTLVEEQTDTPTYLISAVEIRNLVLEGSCQLASTQLATLTSMAVDIVSMVSYRSVNSTCYTNDGFLDLERMGLTALNTVMRFSFPPIPGDEVFFFVEETSPMFGPEPGEERSVCLQVDFLASNFNPQGMPPPPLSLLQYNMNAPTLLTILSQTYDDVAYNGARRVLYTGGTGKLTDGVIGTDPVSVPNEWVGFQEPDSAGLRLFFNKEYPVKEIRVYYWNALAVGTATPTGGVRNRNGNRIMQFSFNTQTVDASTASLNVYRGVIENPMMMDYMELILRTAEQALLITEVSVLQDMGGGELVDIPTGLTSKSFSPVLAIATVAATTLIPIDTTTSPFLPGPTSSEVLTIVYASMGIIGFLSILIVSMCMLFLVIFLCMRKGAKSQRPRSPPPKHGSLMRQLSDKYLGTGDKTCYNQFAGTGDSLYTEMDNIYQQVDRPLPLPPVPGEDASPRPALSKEESYMEMEQAAGIGLRIDTGERPPLKMMHTLSEDDYAPVTPPSVPAGHKEPPMRLISDPYVLVTPPHDAKPGFKLSEKTIEETYEAVTPPNSASHTMATLGMSSIPNQYVSMATPDTQNEI